VLTWPLPSDDAAPVAEPETVYLGAGEQATISYAPNLTGTRFQTPVVAVSKRADSSYTIKMDDQVVWGPAAIPPTDIDNTEAVWIPARSFESTLTIKVANLRSSGGDRRYSALPIGWEEP